MYSNDLYEDDGNQYDPRAIVSRMNTLERELLNTKEQVRRQEQIINQLKDSLKQLASNNTCSPPKAQAMTKVQYENALRFAAQRVYREFGYRFSDIRLLQCAITHPSIFSGGSSKNTISSGMSSIYGSMGAERGTGSTESDLFIGTSILDELNKIGCSFEEFAKSGIRTLNRIYVDLETRGVNVVKLPHDFDAFIQSIGKAINISETFLFAPGSDFNSTQGLSALCRAMIDDAGYETTFKMYLNAYEKGVRQSGPVSGSESGSGSGSTLAPSSLSTSLSGGNNNDNAYFLKEEEQDQRPGMTTGRESDSDKDEAETEFMDHGLFREEKRSVGYMGLPLNRLPLLSSSSSSSSSPYSSVSVPSERKSEGIFIRLGSNAPISNLAMFGTKASSPSSNKDEFEPLAPPIRIAEIEYAMDNADKKSRLQEIAQRRYAGLPSYEVLTSTGPSHSPSFKVKCCFRGLTCIADGSTKKNAEKAAAEAMLNKLRKYAIM